VRQRRPGSRSGIAALVPRGENLGLLPERREGLPRFRAVSRIFCAKVEVFAPSPEPEVPGECPGPVSETSRVAGLAGVEF
jgi:hypothetical protein